MERARAALSALKNSGINTVVDASTYDIGRDPVRLRRLSEQTGIHIVCTTGFFSSLDHSFGNFSEDQITRIYVDDLTKGMANGKLKDCYFYDLRKMLGVTFECGDIVVGPLANDPRANNPSDYDDRKLTTPMK